MHASLHCCYAKNECCSFNPETCIMFFIICYIADPRILNSLPSSVRNPWPFAVWICVCQTFEVTCWDSALVMSHKRPYYYYNWNHKLPAQFAIFAAIQSRFSHFIAAKIYSPATLPTHESWTVCRRQSVTLDPSLSHYACFRVKRTTLIWFASLGCFRRMLQRTDLGKFKVGCT